MDLILKGGTVVTASDLYRADIGIENGKIARIGLNLDTSSGRCIDVGGKYLLPGAIDVHTHLDVEFQGQRSVEDFYSGTQAAAHGGVTTVIDYVIPKTGQTLVHALEDWKRKAHDKAMVDYSFHMAVFEPSDANIAQMKEIVAEGFPSFKIFMMGNFDAYAPQYMQVMEEAGRLSALVNVHAEDGACLCHLARNFEKAGRRGHTHFADSVVL